MNIILELKKQKGIAWGEVYLWRKGVEWKDEWLDFVFQQKKQTSWFPPTLPCTTNRTSIQKSTMGEGMCVPYSTYLKSSMEWGVASGIPDSSHGHERRLDANHAMKVLSSEIQVSPEVPNTFSHWGVPQTQKTLILDSQGLIATGVLPATCLLQQNLLTHLTVMSLIKCSASSGFTENNTLLPTAASLDQKHVWKFLGCWHCGIQ